MVANAITLASDGVYGHSIICQTPLCLQHLHQGSNTDDVVDTHVGAPSPALLFTESSKALLVTLLLQGAEALRCKEQVFKGVVKDDFAVATETSAALWVMKKL